MHINTGGFDVKKIKTIIKERFRDNKRGWEITESDTEKSAIENGCFYMHNKQDTTWTFYKMKCKGVVDSDFMVVANIQPLDTKTRGQFGLVWGFNEGIDTLNRFSVSECGKYVLIMDFDKDHRRILYRLGLRDVVKINPKKGVEFCIIKVGDHYYFLINRQLVAICHEQHFTLFGEYIGYYIEPGMQIRSGQFDVKILKTKRSKDGFLKNNLKELLD